MEIVFSLFWLLYLGLVFACYLTWRGINIPQGKLDREDLPAVSVVIAMRNEASNLEMLLGSLQAQDYPTHKLEVIAIDDHSQDQTAGLLSRFYQRTHLNFHWQTIKDPHEFAGSFKKRALTLGIEQASHPYIVTTDADCRFNATWLSSLISFMVKEKALFVSGPVRLIGADSTGSHLRDLEFAGLTGMAASFLKWGYPNMCNGANLAFTRKAFMEVEGYKGFENVVSGDDEFLLYKVSQKFPGRIRFFKSGEAMVDTLAPENWREFFQQRKRWSGKWKYHRSWITRGLALFVFTFYVLLLASTIMALTGAYSGKLLLFQWLLKMAMDWLLVSAVMRFQGKKTYFQWFLLGQLLYSFYAMVFGILANTGGYQWKNRNYK